MKQITLLLIPLFLVLAIQAQVIKSVTITPGSLKTTLTAEELNTITHLTVEGYIDARDFKTMRDSMPTLSNLNLSNVSIATYSGMEGTSFSITITVYPANEIPQMAFYNKPNISVVVMPVSTLSVGQQAFFRCNNLQSIDLPPLLTRIGKNAFGDCTALTTLTIPSSVTEVGEEAFKNCSGLTSLSISSSLKRIRKHTFLSCSSLTSVSIPSSVTSIDEGAFSGCRGLKSITLPTSVISIGEISFGYCTSLTSFTLPSSVASIGNGAFYGNLALKTFYANPSVPVDLSQSNIVFPYFDSFYCKLMVPYQSRARYAASKTWKDFPKIEEAPIGIALDVNYLEYDAGNYSYPFEISANVDWSISSDQPWLTVDTPSGTGNNRVTLTLEANPTIYRRRGQISVSSATESIAQIITIVQEGAAKTITLTPGSLITSLTKEEMKGITTLTLEGTMDARDFKTLRDNMHLLTTLDLSRTTVTAYSGPEGTVPLHYDPTPSYKANTIPKYAFNSPWPTSVDENIDKNKLKAIVLPSSIITIDKYAFIDCEGLIAVEIPEGVEKIETYAFQYCDQLVSVNLPSSLHTLGFGVFQECTSLKEIISKRANPIEIQRESGVFLNVKKFTCNLYVPAGSKGLYAVAYEWKDFNIVEMTTSAHTELNMPILTCYPNPFTQQMSIEVANPSHKEVSVDIYSISGHKIKTLARARKESKISFCWDGSNEQGLQVLPGIYFCKVNGEVVKVVKR